LLIEGKVETLSRRGRIIARFPRPVEIGDNVCDARNKEMGKVSWVFGPVGSPFVEIEPSEEIKRRLVSIRDRKLFVKR